MGPANNVTVYIRHKKCIVTKWNYYGTFFMSLIEINP